MALPATLYRFKIELSDIDRGLYQSLDFRIAQHPSESPAYLLTRVIAYTLNFQEGLEFSPQGLSDPDAPALQLVNTNGKFKLWIEIANPSAKKLHKASKTSEVVKVYTYKDPHALIKELGTQHVHNLEALEIYSLNTKFLEKLEQALARDNKWSLVYTDGTITVNLPDSSEQSEITPYKLKN